MKRIIKFMLLAAFVLPAWLSTAAQNNADRAVKAVPDEDQVRIEAPVYLQQDRKQMREANKAAQSQVGNTYKAPTRATTIGTETVCNGTSTNEFYPVYGYYFDNGAESQIIYPASLFSDIEAGDKITALTFYVASTTGTIPSNMTNATVTLRVGETANLSTTTVTSSSAMTTNQGRCTQVWQGKLTSGVSEVTFTFTTPYTYRGGNLIIDLVAASSSSYSHCYWYGVSATNASYCTYQTYWGNSYNEGSFRPKMMVTYTPHDPTSILDFGSVEVGSSKTLNARIENPSETTVTASVTATSPFSVVNSTESLPAGVSSIPVTFTPSAANAYSGTLTVTINGTPTTITLKGAGNVTGSPEAIRDSAFFAGIDYTWQENGTGASHTGHLDEIATDPDQMIAMMKKVYMDPTIPGNLHRGYTTSGAVDLYGDVAYTGVGTISHSGSNYTDATTYSWEDDYGWNVPGRINAGDVGVTSDSRYYYAHMDSTQYKPNNEGVTLLLIEMRDDFHVDSLLAYVKSLRPFNTDYDKLRAYISYTYKSVRVVTDAKRTGTGFDKGTLFKIDCDKMNKFYLVAKGQLRYPFNSNHIFNDQDHYSLTRTFCRLPLYAYTTYSNVYYQGDESLGHEGFMDYNCGDEFGAHMFEQFSPYNLNDSSRVTDIYADLVAMNSYPVPHDCISVPSATPQATPAGGHFFRMYGDDSESADCQDVRDMMFFVPDYRMMFHYGRDTGKTTYNNDSIYATGIKYQNYNPHHMPKMGLYVIHQDSITPTTAAEDYYMLNLHWRTNMDDFLPSDQQEFELLQLVYDEETGQSNYVPVYYMNAQGQYTDANGNVVSEANKVPIVLHMEAGRVKNYPSVYVERLSHSQEVTYAIRGRDTGHFLGLQISNQQSYIIPGTDPAEMIMLKDATHYSRFNPETVKNCYSNKIQLSNNAGGIKNARITDGDNGTKMEIYRSHNEKDANNETVTIDELVATITFLNHNSSNRSIKVKMANQDAKTEYPVGQTDVENDSTLYYAGYHANNLGTVEDNGEWTHTYTVRNGYVNFGTYFSIFDNFVVDVASNNHPSFYNYKVVTNYTDPEVITNGGTAHGNTFRVPVYKTGSQINGSFTKEQVDGDDAFELSLDDDVKFGVDVQLSSKTEILRYDAYRWDEGETRYIIDDVMANGNEGDIAPTGLAMNQGEYYTISMNPDTENETNGNASVSSGSGTATFVDLVPVKSKDAGAYIYAPVVELFTTGKNENNKTRSDYNTYGGPLKNTAIGKLDVEVVEPSTQVPLMSNFSWIDSTGNVKKKYAYYQIFLDVKSADVPEGYSLYGIRAWRHVEESLLGEHPRFPRPDRTPEDDEDIMFEKIIGGTGYDASYEYLGSAAASYEDAQIGEVRGTFGAQKLRTTEPATDQSVIDELNAEFTVRLYFTRTANMSTYPPIYVVGNNGNGWDFNNPIATLYSLDGTNYTSTVTIPNSGDGKGYFIFSKQLGSSWDNNNQYIFGADWGEGNALVGPQGYDNIWDFALRYWRGGTKTFQITPGTYKFTISNHYQSVDEAGADFYAGGLNISQITSKAPLREAGSDADGKYYVVEQTLNFHADGGNVPTGIFDIADGKQVVSVKYYNVAGIESDKPFDGVNIVVTRFNDGSTATQKMMK